MTTTLGERSERLRDAIERWGTIRRLERELDGRPIRGKTRSMLHRYLRGDPEPPAGFLRAIAPTLGVRADWLVDGSGARTEAEERHRPDTDHVVRAIVSTFPLWRFGSLTMRRAVHQTFIRIAAELTARDEEWLTAVGSIDPDEPYPPALEARALEHDTEAARQTGRAFMAPLLALDTDLRALTSAQLEDYARAMALALGALYPTPHRFAAPIGTIAKPEDLIPEAGDAPEA